MPMCDWFPCGKDGNRELVTLEPSSKIEAVPVGYMTTQLGYLCEGHFQELARTIQLYRMGNAGLKRNGPTITRETLSAFATSEDSEPMPSQQPADWQEE